MTAQPVKISKHGRTRMNQRGVKQEAIRAVLHYGRRVRRPGAVVYVIGRREVQRWRVMGINLSDYVNLHVVFGSDGVVITTYRNRDFRHLRCG